jgi:hypothetical protein
VLCPAYNGKAAERDAVTDAAPIILEELNKGLIHSGHPVPIAVAGAIYLARYGLDKLCADTA